MAYAGSGKSDWTRGAAAPRTGRQNRGLPPPAQGRAPRTREAGGSMMVFRRETKPSMLRRCRGWDYCQPCIYQITLVLADRRSEALGRLVIPGAAASGRGQAGARSVLEAAASSYIALTSAGEAVMLEWLEIAAHHPEVRPLFMQVMPDHVHFVLQVSRPMAKPLGNVIGGFKGGSSKAAIGKAGLWAEGFQDTILFHERQLRAMFDYLRDNPRRLAIKRLCPDLFKVKRSLKLPLQAQNRPSQTEGRSQ